MDAGVTRFEPKGYGAVNRSFSDVKRGGPIYCYETHSGGRVILRLIRDDELKIEYQSDTCAGGYRFSKPTSYHR